MRRRWHRVLASSTGLCFALVASTQLGTVSAAAVSQVCTSGVPGDVNGDGYAEVAVTSSLPAGVHLFYGQPDGVTVEARGTALDDQLFTMKTLGSPHTEPTDVAELQTVLADLDDDGCADLVVVARRDGDCGSLTVLWGSPQGLSATRRQRIAIEDIPPRGDLCGVAYEGGLTTGDFNRDGATDLVVGLPGAFDDASGLGGRGAVVLLLGEAGGGLSVVPGRTWEVDPSTPGLPPNLERGDFGEAVTAGDFDGDGFPELALGLPYEGDGRGAVQVLEFGSEGISGQQPMLITATTAGVPRAARHAVRLGAKLAAGDIDNDGDDELVTSLAGSPAILVLPGSTHSLTGPGSQLLREKAMGLKNTEDFSEPGALVVAPLDATAGADLVVGDGRAWGGSTPGAGAVSVMSGGAGRLAEHPHRVLSEATRGVRGSPERFDDFGGVLSTLYIQGSDRPSLIVGTRAEKIGTWKDVGRVYQFRRGASGPRPTGSRVLSLDVHGVKGLPVNYAHFGEQLSH